MEVYEREIRYDFKCKGCGFFITADSNDFELVDIGVLGYLCPACKKKRIIKPRNLTRKVIYVKKD